MTPAPPAPSAPGLLSRVRSRLFGGSAASSPAMSAAIGSRFWGAAGLGRSYNGGSVSDPDLASWTTANPAPQVAIATDRNILTARIHDLARNDGWASGGVKRMVDACIGSTWRLASKPNATALGITEEQAADVAAQIEAQWRLWAENVDFACDAGERMNWGGLLGLAFRHRVWDGEALAQMVWKERPWAYSTCVQIIHPDRLSNPNNGPDLFDLRGGVELGAHGEPVAYHVRGAHPGEAYFANIKVWTWTRVARRTSWGRPVMIHAFEAEAAGQFRGVSMFAPILKKLRMLGRYDEVELQASILNATLAAFVTTPFDQEQLAKAMDGGEDGGLSAFNKERLDFHDAAPISLNGAKINFLSTGEDIKLSQPNHPNSVFEAFERMVLRNISTALGVSYEQLSMDWSQVNYSSARAALLEIWRGFTARKDAFAAQFVKPIYAAWLEEAIDRGDVVLPKGAPDFYAAKTAWCAAKWIGPPRGWVDPMKEAQAAVTRMEAGLSNLEIECAEQGIDWQENLVAQARINAERERLGVPAMIPQQLAKQIEPVSGEDAENPDDKKPSDKQPSDKKAAA